MHNATNICTYPIVIVKKCRHMMMNWWGICCIDVDYNPFSACVVDSHLMTAINHIPLNLDSSWYTSIISCYISHFYKITKKLVRHLNLSADYRGIINSTIVFNCTMIRNFLKWYSQLYVINKKKNRYWKIAIQMKDWLNMPCVVLYLWKISSVGSIGH
jgi:hypothetical protein